MLQLFEILFVVGNLTKFPREKSFLRGNLNCHIFETEGRRKPKFGEVRLQFQNF